MSKNTIYLVTGAAGFLGGTVCRQLLARGERVRALVMPGDPAAKYVPERAELLYGDLTDFESLERFFHVPADTETVVLHIASIVTVNLDYNPKVMEVNVGGTKNMLKLALRHRECRKFVYCSSTGAIPEEPRDGRIAETDRFDADRVVGCYSRSKALASQAVLDAARTRGLNACIVHPSGIMGPGDFALGETTGTLLRIINGEMPAGIAGTFNLCDVRDLAAGVIAAAEKGERGECYILGNEAISFRNFAKIICEESGCRPMRLFLPIPVAGLMASIMEKAAERRGSKPLLTGFSVYNLARNNRFDSAKAKRALGYTTRSYEETLRDEIAWLRETGKIPAEQGRVRSQAAVV